jgi:predicted nucleic acid-binding protein
MGSERVIADTCIWIEYFKGRTPISAELKRLIQAGKVVLTGLIIFELLQGVKTKKDAELIKEAALALPVLEMTVDTWLSAGDLFFELRRKGITLPPSDVLLSAVVIENNLSLFTIDNHFNHIPQIRLYQNPGKGK